LAAQKLDPVLHNCGATRSDRFVDKKKKNNEKETKTDMVREDLRKRQSEKKFELASKMTLTKV
jgi:hypothetical protein